MDIKVITRHAVTNYGSLLQSIATLKILERLGHNASIIDYIREDELGLNITHTELSVKPEWNNNIVKRVLYYVSRYPGEYFATKKFEKMRSKHLKLTDKQYNKASDLSSLEADIFMTGSDQVWGPVLNGEYDDAYFLSFAKDSVKKIAFAASFGKVDIDDYFKSKFATLLQRYTSIAVREDAAIKHLNNIGISSARQVLDPTLLLTGEEWSRFIDKDIQGKYILIYQLHASKEFNDYAKRFAKNVNLPLLRVSPYIHKFNEGGKFIYLPDISEFLSYIKNCEYFITDSFHGTVFALNFNKKFIEILPKTRQERNRSILKLTGLEDRIVTDFNDFSIADKAIDYSMVNNIINIEREKSIAVLTELCKDA